MLSTVKYVPQFYIVHRPYDTLCTAAVNNSTTKQMQQHKPPHSNSETGTVTNPDWICKYCSYTNNEEVSLAVFGDYHEGQDGAQFCIIGYQYCMRQYTKR